MFAVALVAVVAGQSRPAVTVRLLAINDFHGNLEPPTGGNGFVNGTEAGGAEYLATHLKNDVAGHPLALIVSAGDLIGASPLTSGLFHDEPTIEAMNAMNVSVSSVGNHEFDHGTLELLRMQNGGCHPVDGCRDGDRFAGAAFQYLAANVVHETTRMPFMPATAIRTIGGVRIGFIGETLRSTKDIVVPASTAGLTFLDEAATANRDAADLTRQGVRAIVLLIHQGGEQHPPAHVAADPNGCAGLTGPILSIAGKLSPDIKVVISGHTHQFYNCAIAGHTVTSAGAYGRLLTRIDLTIDPASDAITNVAATNEVVTRDVPKDAAQTAIIAKYEALSAGVANRVVGSVTADILREPNAAGESSLGDVIADAQLAATHGAADGGADIALMNPGGIRSDLVAARPDATGEPRPVTYKALYQVQPFGNTLTVLTMTGDMIARLLERQFDNPDPGDRTVLQISSGLTYRYSMNGPAGHHVEPRSIMLNGRALAAGDRVRVAANDYLSGGGDRMTIFSEGTRKTVGVVDVDALVAYFASHSPIAPGARNRIVRTD